MSSRGVERRFSVTTALACAALAAAGCAPRQFDRAIVFYADQERVSDAAARRSSAAWFLRFDAELLHELDAAIAQPDEPAARSAAERALRGAKALAVRSTNDEIRRMSAGARAQLAGRAGCAPDVESLLAEVGRRAAADLEAELAVERGQPFRQWRRRLEQIRAGVEPLPDDRERAARQLLLVGLSPLVSAGIDRKESEIRASLRQRSTPRVAQAEIWEPALGGQDAPARWAPIIVMPLPAARDYPADFDRLGAVALSGTRDSIKVSIRPGEPVVYTYESAAFINGQRFRQVCYVWWFSDRPAMSPDDHAAGHIDGGTLRVTLDRSNRPAIAEIILNCGCGHEVYVAEEIEAAAAREFGQPEEGARYSVERHARGGRPVLVAGTFDRRVEAGRPIVVLSAGTHEPVGLVFDAQPSGVVGTVVARRRFELLDYDLLDRLPLGDGVASMFGPDGLVHFAGRAEGLLLAPSGILSAGQPRKRGTQRVRWDAYLFDDPDLLARTLRLPATF